MINHPEDVPAAGTLTIARLGSMTVRTVGVVGAGTIGRGVAQSFAQAGFDVILIDVEKGRLPAALAEIAGNLRVQPLFGRAGGRPDTEAVIGRIRTGTDPEPLGDADFVVENVTEDWDVKRPVYETLDAVCPPDTIFAVNTSAIPITRVASATTRPAKVLGMHFMNPVPLTDMVEVIRGHFTSDDTVDSALGLLRLLGKDSVIVGDAPGFVTNRVMMLTINEAICCLQDRVATAEEVDRIFKGCFGHRMGPLETGDLIGLDTILNSIMVLYESYRDGKYRPAPLLRRMVDAGLLGRKTGQGFYDYRIPGTTAGRSAK